MLKKRWSLAFIFLAIGIITGWISSIDAEVKLVPSWIKNIAKFWVNDEISDQEFLNALQFLVDKGVLVLPTEESKNISESTSTQLNKKDFKQIQEIEYEKTAIPIGTSVTQGSFKITLERIGLYKYLTFSDKPKEGLRADFMIENISTYYKFNPSNVILIDDKYKQYRTTSFIDGTLGLEELAPKATKEGFVVFEGFKEDSNTLSIIIEQYDFPQNYVWKWDVEFGK